MVLYSSSCRISSRFGLSVGIGFLVKNPDSWGEHVPFAAFKGGLLAKSVLDLIKNLFKNVFRA
jgi:hypothetical protein